MHSPMVTGLQGHCIPALLDCSTIYLPLVFVFEQMSDHNYMPSNRSDSTSTSQKLEGPPTSGIFVVEFRPMWLNICYPHSVGGCKLQLHLLCSLFLCVSFFVPIPFITLLLGATFMLVSLSFVSIVSLLCVLLLWTTFVPVPLLLSPMYIVCSV
jgi:hypothetical protein